jgi:SAM-dependent methyltransferase
MTLLEAHIQALIAILELKREGRLADPDGLSGCGEYFGKYLLEWDQALDELIAAGLLERGVEGYALTEAGQAQAEALRFQRPPKWYWYRQYYEAVATSRAYAEFCRRTFGRDLGQHGFADMDQLDLLLQVTALGPGNRALDLGCGNGRIAEYLSDTSGAHLTGIDYIPTAIAQAMERTQAKRDRVSFGVGDISDPGIPPRSFDTLISVDTAYFVELEPALTRWRKLLTPGGQMALLYSHGANPETPIERFDRRSLPADKTPLGVALRSHGLSSDSWDLTEADYRHAQRKKLVLEELKEELECEGNGFLYENRYGEALGVIAAIEAGAHARYLYHVRI